MSPPYNFIRIGPHLETLPEENPQQRPLDIFLIANGYNQIQL
jgi:hypothetical protein